MIINPRFLIYMPTAINILSRFCSKSQQHDYQPSYFELNTNTPYNLELCPQAVSMAMTTSSLQCNANTPQHIKHCLRGRMIRDCVAAWCTQKPECPLCRAPSQPQQLICLGNRVM